MERINAPHGIRHVLSNALVDPASPISADGLDGGFLLCCKALKEEAEHFQPMAFVHPDDTVGVVVDDDSDVVVPLGIARLIHADMPEAVEPLAGVRLQNILCTVHAAAHGFPVDAHDLGNCSLGRFAGQPCSLHVEVFGEARSRVSPGYGGSDDAMLRTLDARRGIPQIDQSAAAIKGSPCPRRPVAAVVARAPAPAMRANALQALIRAQIESQDSFLMAAKQGDRMKVSPG